MQFGFFFLFCCTNNPMHPILTDKNVNYAQYEIHTYSVFLFKASLLCS